MSRLVCSAIAFALSLGCPVFNRAADSQTQTTKKAPTGSVSGRITIHGKGAAGIVVGLRSTNYSPQQTPAPKATTDEDGNYRIAEVPAGNYQVTPLAPIYIVADQPSSRSRGKSLLLAEGEDVQGVDFSLVRGGVITGKVTDTDGRPIVDERLTLLPENQSNEPGQMFSPAVPNTSQTDDRGIYRIYGIPPGRFKISVGLAEDGYSNVNAARAVYKRTFYPDATDPSDAKVIEITEGGEVTNIDITVGRSLPAFSASGKITDGETGRPVSGMRVGLRRVVNEGNSPMMNGIISASNSLGEFRLENVTPGKYAAFVWLQPPSEIRSDAVNFEIVDQDVTGIVIQTLKGLSVTGTLVLDGPYNKNVLPNLGNLRLRVYVSGDSPNGDSWQETVVNADGSFRLGGLAPGIAAFSLSFQDRRPATSFSIQRIERDGVVGPPRGIEIKSGEQAGGVKIFVSYGSSAIRGEVKIENGPLPSDGRIMVWLKKPGENPASFRPYNLDSRGRFLIEGIAAGTYELNVDANIPSRRSAATAKQLVTVTDDTVSDVIVSLDLKTNPGQRP